MFTHIRCLLALLALLLAGAGTAQAQKGLVGKIDLMSSQGVDAVKGQWRYAVVTTGVGAKKNEIERAENAFTGQAVPETSGPP